MATLQRTGLTGSLSISSSNLPTGSILFSVDGYNGRVFSVDDNLSGSLFSVNTIAGLPVLEAFSDNRVVAGKYGSNDFVITGNKVGIGTTSIPEKLTVLGNISSSGTLTTPNIFANGGTVSYNSNGTTVVEYAGIVETPSDYPSCTEKARIYTIGTINANGGDNSYLEIEVMGSHRGYTVASYYEYKRWIITVGDRISSRLVYSSGQSKVGLWNGTDAYGFKGQNGAPDLANGAVLRLIVNPNCGAGFSYTVRVKYANLNITRGPFTYTNHSVQFVTIPNSAFHLQGDDISLSATGVASNVGIGINPPGYPLHVVNTGIYHIVAEQSSTDTNNVNAYATFYAINNAGSSLVKGYLGVGGNSVGNGSMQNCVYVGAQTNHNLRLFTNDTAKVTIDTTGNVGIGTTLPASLLHVYNNAARYLTYSGNGGLTIQRNAIVTGGATSLWLINTQGTEFVNRGTGILFSLGYGGSGTSAGTTAPGGKIVLLSETGYSSNAADQNAYLAFFTSTTGSLSEKLRIRSDGSLSPITVSSTTAGATLLRADGTNGTLFSVVDDLSDSLLSVNNSAGLPVFEVFADDRIVGGQYGQNNFVIVNNKVGIGTNNPSTLLQIGTGSPTSVTGGIQFGDDTSARIYRSAAGTVTIPGNISVSGTIVFPNTSNAGLTTVDGTALFRLDDIYGNIYLVNSAGGFYVDATSHNFRNASSVVGMTINSSGDVSAARYVYGTYVNTSDDANNGSITYIMAKFGDNFHRSATAAKVAAFISGQSINTTGNAATADIATYARRVDGATRVAINVGGNTSNFYPVVLQIGSGATVLQYCEFVIERGGYDEPGYTNANPAGGNLFSNLSIRFTCKASGWGFGSTYENVEQHGATTPMVGDWLQRSEPSQLIVWLRGATVYYLWNVVGNTTVVNQNSGGGSVTVSWGSPPTTATYNSISISAQAEKAKYARYYNGESGTGIYTLGNIRCDGVFTGSFSGPGTGLTGTAAGLNIGGTAGGETLSTVSGRGNTTQTQLIVSTANGQPMFVGRQAGAGYSNGAAGIFNAISDNPNGTVNSFFQGYNSGSSNVPGGILAYSVRADGQIYTTMNTATGIANNSFSVGKTLTGTIHIANGSGADGNNRQAAITFQGSVSNESQAGIYVSNNVASGTAMGFATTDNYTTGPQLFMTATNVGVVNFPRARPTYAGNTIIDTAYSGTVSGLSIGGTAATATTANGLNASNQYSVAGITGSIQTVAVRETYVAVAAAPTTTINLSNGTVVNLSFGASITQFNINGVDTGKVNSFTLITAPNGTLATISWSFSTNGGAAANVKWAANAVPTATTTANRWDVYSFVYNGSAWYGFTGGQNYS